MKKFKDMLAETVRGGGGNMPVYGDYAVGYSPSVISKINSIIGRYTIEDLVDPYVQLHSIRGTLNNLGLTFDQIDDDSFVEQAHAGANRCCSSCPKAPLRASESNPLRL